MSHADDGMLHAYLDGELPQVEAERLAAHLAVCERCRGRADEERALIERASSLLGLAVPSTGDRPAPPLATLRRTQPVWRLRTPLAWAATVVLALGLGWLAGARLGYRATMSEDRSRVGDNVVTVGPPTSEPRPAAPPTRGRFAPSPGRVSSERQTAGAGELADRSAREESDETQPVAKAAAPEPQAAPPAPMAPAEAKTRAGAVASGLETTGPRDRSTSWPAIGLQVANDLLGMPPVTIPGYPVRTFRRNPARAEVAVEQSMPDGVIVLLYETRVEAAGAVASRSRDDRAAAPRLQQAPSTNELLARFVSGLRVEIAGSIAADSLSRLLDLVR